MCQPPFLSTDIFGRKFHRGKWWLPGVCQPTTISLDGFSWEKISSRKMVAPQSVSTTTISLDEFSCEKISSRKMVAPWAGRPVPRLVPLAVGGLAVSPSPRLVVAPCAGRPGDTKSLDDGWKKFFRVIEENGGSPE